MRVCSLALHLRSEEPMLGARRAKVQWVQRDACGALIRRFERRAEVEEVCEFEAHARGEVTRRHQDACESS